MHPILRGHYAHLFQENFFPNTQNTYLRLSEAFIGNFVSMYIFVCKTVKEIFSGIRNCVMLIVHFSDQNFVSDYGNSFL